MAKVLPYIPSQPKSITRRWRERNSTDLTLVLMVESMTSLLILCCCYFLLIIRVFCSGDLSNLGILRNWHTHTSRFTPKNCTYLSSFIFIWSHNHNFDVILPNHPHKSPWQCLVGVPGTLCTQDAPSLPENTTQGLLFKPTVQFMLCY